MSPDVPGAELLTNAAPGRWVEDALRSGRHWTVETFVPPVFESYARLLHPLQDNEPSTRDTTWQTPVFTWAELAQRNGVELHAGTRWPEVAGVPDAANSMSGQEGSMPPAFAAALQRILRAFTTTPDECYFGLWEGFGHVQFPEDVPRIHAPSRNYCLYRGPIEVVENFMFGIWRYQSPNVWWPADRAWYATTDIDLDTTYVGGTAACVQAVLAELEGFEVEPPDRIC